MIRGASTRSARAEALQAMPLLGVMTGVALPVGISATRFSQDALVGTVAGALAVLLLIALLQSFGVLGGR